MTTFAWLTLAAIALTTAAVLAWEYLTAPIDPAWSQPRVLYGGDLSTDESWGVLQQWADDAATPQSDDVSAEQVARIQMRLATLQPVTNEAIYAWLDGGERG